MKYKQFSIEEREIIQEMGWREVSIRAIAKALGRNPSSVSREIRRNKPPEYNRYTPRIAHGRALQYRKHRGKRKLEQDAQLRAHVVSHLKLGWSPEQIAATSAVPISHEAIYQYIYAQIHQGGHGYLKPGHEDLRRI